LKFGSECSGVMLIRPFLKLFRQAQLYALIRAGLLFKPFYKVVYWRQPRKARHSIFSPANPSSATESRPLAVRTGPTRKHAKR